VDFVKYHPLFFDISVVGAVAFDEPTGDHDTNSGVLEGNEGMITSAIVMGSCSAIVRI
jgi:hypothetical protein